MQLTDRDKKILIVLPLLAVVALYWFVLLAPKRDEKATVQKQLTEVQAQRDEAVSKAAQLDQARRGYAEDYATVIRLGKALPTTVDTPSLLVQLDRAARGTGIEFDRITTGEREESATAPPPAAPAEGSGQQGGESGGGAGGDAAAGGAPASTAPGQAVEGANNAAATANGQAAEAGQAGATPPAGGAAPAGSSAPGLESIPLDFEFTGSFFDLADFFHRMKRFVRVHNDQVLVRGRLITVDAFTFTTGESFPQLKAEVKATVYLAPRAQGAAAGGTPAGPTATPVAAGTETATTTPPTAAVTR
jgi:Tfp pilus assembly protein PilO